MNLIFRNSEIKSTALKLLLLQILFVLAASMFTRFELNKLQKTIVNSNEALIGNILLKHPELEDEIIGFVTKEASQKDVKKGKDILKQYGYGDDMPLTSNPWIKDFYNGFKLKTTLLGLIWFVPLLLIILYEYKNLFKKVRKISAAAEKVVEGDFSVILPEDSEGDFAILGHNFNNMANRLRLSIERLKEDKIFLKNIISDISHQLKTPLSSLVMFNELMLQDTNMEEDLREGFLERNKSQLDRMEWLILNLLKMARLESGAIEFRKEKVPFIASARKAVNALKDKAEAKNQNLLIKEDSSVCFIGDEDWTTEAIINILKNCIEHTEFGGKITIKLIETPLFSRALIEDQGEGIDKKDLPHVFERFYRGNSTVKSESVGIGLALTRVIIEQQGGTIDVSSEKGKGTKFTITFLKGVI
jgi:signal transduction histidine kinase